MDFSDVPNGGSISLVVDLITYDPLHDSHLLQVHHSGMLCFYTGLLDAGFCRFTICDAVLACQYPMPRVICGEATKVLSHARPGWQDFRKVIDSCSGFGGIAHGALALGMKTTVAVDFNERMLHLHGKHDGCNVVHGDVGLNETIFKVWQRADGAAIMTGGFACQPYSVLGDQRGSQDPRSASLTSVLRAAYMLQVHVLVLECVTPARKNTFVSQSIDSFVKLMNFHKEVVDLHLETVWPCRRARTWWVLTSRALGPTGIKEWQCQSNVEVVQRLIPYVCRWHPQDEMALTLDSKEKIAFGFEDGSYSKFLLKPSDVAPCFLHAYGSQLRACPCGCRTGPLSDQRLHEKGLFGCLLCSAADSSDHPSLRHLHPSEALILVGMDPIIDFGEDVRLTLSAIGQIASPLQSLWVLSFIAARIEELRYGRCEFSPVSQLQAFRSWLVMRSKVVWACNDEMIEDPKLLHLVECWKDQSDLFLNQLVDAVRWQEVIDHDVSIAAILDAVMRNASNGPAHEPNAPMSDEPETPWFDSPLADPKGELCLEGDKCFLTFRGSDDQAKPLSFTAGAAVNDFLTAQAKLVGPFWVSKILDVQGVELPMSHVLQIGQHVQVCLSSAGQGVPFGVHVCQELSGLGPTTHALTDVMMCGCRPQPDSPA